MFKVINCLEVVAVVNKDKNKNIKKGVGRAKFFYSLAATLVVIPFSLIRNFHCKPRLVKEDTFIMMSNHADNYDAAYVVLATGRHMRFVMSDHLVRSPSARFLFNFLTSPIVNHRERSTDELYNEIVANCRAGVSVGIYVEGGKSNNGETGFISKRNAELVKDCGCALVTCRLKGGYLKSPRWADNKRKGPVFAEVVRVYTKEEIDEMSLEEIYEHITSDLYVNAYDEQRKVPHEYIGNNLAQSAEIILYVCPKCCAVGTLKTSGEEIFCPCGFKAHTDAYGFWHSEDMPFDDIVRWDKFQKNIIKELTQKTKDTKDLLFSDSKQIVYKLINGNRVLQFENAEIFLYADRFEITDGTTVLGIPVENIMRVSTASKMKILLVTDSDYYEIHSRKPRSAIKYKVAIRYLQGKENL